MENNKTNILYSKFHEFLNTLFSAAIHYSWIPIFILFLILRLFSGYKYFPLAEDQCTYLTLGRTFPLHQLYNHDLYLIHSPVFGYIIGLTNFIVPLFHASLIATLGFGILTFFAIKRLASSYGLNMAGVVAALFFLSVNTYAIAFDCHIFRYSMLQFFMAMSMLYFHEYLKANKKLFPWKALVFTGLALISSDHALLLLPCLLIQFVAAGKYREQWRPIITFFLCSGLIYAIWPAVRLFVYCTNLHYPAGIDGTIEFVSQLNLKTILQPNYLPYTDFHRSLYTATKFSWNNFSVGNAVGVLEHNLFLPYKISFPIIICLIVTGLILAGIYKDKQILVLFIISIILGWPCFFDMNRWYGLGMLLPFSVLVGKIAHYGTAKHPRYQKILLTLTVLLSLALSVKWLFSAKTDMKRILFQPVAGSHFLFFREPVTRGVSSNNFLSEDLDTGFMTPVGLVPEMVYITSRRFVAIPFDPELLDKFIDAYKIRYLLFNDTYLPKYTDEAMNYAASRVVVQYILDHPEKYEKIKEWHEEYPEFFPPATFYLYEVKRKSFKD